KPFVTVGLDPRIQTPTPPLDSRFFLSFPRKRPPLARRHPDYIGRINFSFRTEGTASTAVGRPLLSQG
ncbi:MAG: hypothetical protein Q8O16_05805, partial [Dehalococcoidia bacterium]|nr:hypothetical protein [Dehalococcoidia bacterium]